MIYAGHLCFNNMPKEILPLKKAIQTYTNSAPRTKKQGVMTLCYGKISDIQDKDEIWESNSSIIMGRIFDKENECSVSQKAFAASSYGNKEDDLKNIWGKFVYIRNNTSGSQVEIVVDSTGQLPFFYFLFPNGDVLFSSHIEIIFKILSQKPEINWSYLCSYLIFGNSCTVQTPFQNVFRTAPWLLCDSDKKKTI